MKPPRDEFLSEEDLDFGRLPEAERSAWCDEWLLLAQAANEADRDLYAHGVFTETPPAARAAPRGGGAH